LDELIATVLNDSNDRTFVALWRLGERRTGAFANVLEIGDWPLKAQRRAVKRTKDRIIKTLQRAAKKLGWLKPAQRTNGYRRRVRESAAGMKLMNLKA
jgi:hypothetical protein